MTTSAELPFLQYQFKPDRENVRAVDEARDSSCILRGIIEIVTRNSTDGGFTPYLELDGERVEIADYFEASDVHDRWTPVNAEIVRCLLTRGYAVIIVDAEAEDSDDRLFVPDADTYEVRWGYRNFKRVYKAFPSEQLLNTSFLTSATGGGESMMPNMPPVTEPIKNSFVLTMYHPTKAGKLTSPVSQTLPYVNAINEVLSAYLDVVHSQAQPPIFTEAVAQSTPEENIPFMATTLEPDTGVQLRRIDVASRSAAGKAIRNAHAFVERNRMGTANAAAEIPNSIQGTVRYQGRAVADLSAGRTLANESKGPTMDIASNVEMVQEILTFIGRTFGVTAEYLQGNEGRGGSRLIAGVEASRRQLAVMVSSLQQPLSKFLQRVFAAYYAPLLRELIASSRPVKHHGDEGPPPKKKRKLTAETSMAMHQDKIIIIFNNIPFLDYANLRQACLDGVITPDEFRDMAGRMYHIPLSGQTTSYDLGPRELLLEPILASIEANKMAAQAKRAGAPAASEGTKVN